MTEEEVGRSFSGLFDENQRTSPLKATRQIVTFGSIELESGATLPSFDIAFETWGRLNEDKSNAILVCHALTGDSHCVGWWDQMVGPGKAIDTERYFIICSNSLGGCQGSTGPSSLHPDGQKYGTRFPHITVGDMVACQNRLVTKLGIEKLLCVAGGSMGGMQAIEWAIKYPNQVETCFATASCAYHNAMQIGFNEAGRQAIMRDPKWANGMYSGEGPVNGIAVSRMIGHLTFLSDFSFAKKFGRNLQDRKALSYAFETEFQIESYLNYQGDKFAQRFDANSFLYITKAIDYFCRTDFSGAMAEFLFVSFESDWIYPSYQSEELKSLAVSAGCQAKHLCLDIPFGHDSFLLDGEHQANSLREMLDRHGAI